VFDIHLNQWSSLNQMRSGRVVYCEWPQSLLVFVSIFSG